MDAYSENKFVFFIVGSCFLFVSVLLHVFQKEKGSIITLICAAFFIFLSAALLYPILHVWDERFHALVAKNMMEHPLMPTLYDDTVVNMAYDRWDRDHIWIHKQPLFLWQIALSYKLFGVNELALRLPSVILSCVLVFAGYRSGKILGNKNIGYYTGFLIVTSFYLKELISGWQQLDHNDVSFLVYISLSLWAWLEYQRSKKWWWLVLIGVFSGFAILCKWLVGLLVYSGWGVYSFIENKWQVKKYWDITLSFAVTLLVAVPWQVLTFIWYPAEAKAIYKHNSNHIFEAVEGHEGPLSYHFTQMNELYGSLALYLIIPALIIFYKRGANKRLCLALIINTVFVYLFFTIAATKMPSFTIVAILPVFISLAFLIDSLVVLLARLKLAAIINRTAVVLFLSVLAFMRIDVRAMNEINNFTTEDGWYIGNLKSNKRVFQSLNLPKNAVIFNVKGRHYVEAMFYSGLPAYGFIPSNDQYTDLKKKNRLVAVFRTSEDSIPPYLEKDSTTIYIKEQIQLCE